MESSTMDLAYRRLEHEYNELLQSYNKLLHSNSVMRKFAYGSVFLSMCGGAALGLCLYCWLKSRRQAGKGAQPTSRNPGDGFGGVELQPLSSPGRAVVRGEDDMTRELLPRYRPRDTAPRYSVTDPHTQRPQAPWSNV
ncbi:hypothetical protein CEP51_009873 [Fusarium floridanum]|uniref:Uncharacterized protein n=1 Tax=Fusarium floridanum TaxID=1325733 RepID=A0A428RGA9_9HYPO|nr:hypothetical protein CEP51_009873 [Fusarium floridanum]